MKLIGIITRKNISDEGHSVHIEYDDILNAIYKNNGIPLGINLSDDYKEVLNLCDGVIFQGGDEFEKYDLEALKYLYEIDKPVLCICLGMQLMGTLFNGKLIKIENHKYKSKYVHSINIKKDTKLYDIIRKEKIKVNSRHKYSVDKCDLDISSKSDDGYIESIEDKSKKFFIGVQWHPESMIGDSNQNKVFKEFLNSCENSKLI